MTMKKPFRPLLCPLLRSLLCAGAAVLALMSVGCGSQDSSAGPGPAAVSQALPPNAPSAADVDAQRAVAFSMMAQSRNAARAVWMQHHPGKPLPTGL